MVHLLSLSVWCFKLCPRAALMGVWVDLLCPCISTSMSVVIMFKYWWCYALPYGGLICMELYLFISFCHELASLSYSRAPSSPSISFWAATTHACDFQPLLCLWCMCLDMLSIILTCISTGCSPLQVCLCYNVIYSMWSALLSCHA